MGAEIEYIHRVLGVKSFIKPENDTPIPLNMPLNIPFKKKSQIHILVVTDELNPFEEELFLKIINAVGVDIYEHFQIPKKRELFKDSHILRLKDMVLRSKKALVFGPFKDAFFTEWPSSAHWLYTLSIQDYLGNSQKINHQKKELWARLKTWKDQPLNTQCD